jgi:hypothetical protein
LTGPEIELLIHGLSDDVSFGWALRELELRGNPPNLPDSPTPTQIDSAFEVFERLTALGLVKIGRIEYIDRGPSGRFAPVEHIVERVDEVRDRVERACRDAEKDTDWEFACWLVNTDAGDRIARNALASETGPPDTEV